MCARALKYIVVSALSFVLVTSAALAQKKYDVGADDNEIRIGNTGPYSGPGSGYSIVPKTQAAYFKKINDEGGINGRKIKFISYDDASSPPKTVEQVRRLVEDDEVLLIFNSLGTPNNVAISKYLNSKKVPQLFAGSAATRFGDPANAPWTMGWAPTYFSEGFIYAKYILQNKPDAKIAVLSQNDDYGKDILKGLKDGLGDRASGMIVAENAFDITTPTIESNVVLLKDSGADVFVNLTTTKFAAQAIRKVAELGWKPLQIVNNVGNSVGGVLMPAGLENAIGVISTAYLKDPTDESWKNDPGKKEMDEFLTKYYPDADRNSISLVYGYSHAQTLVHVLKQCGDDLTRENVMRQAANIKDLEQSMLLPGIKINTGPNDFFPVEDMQLMRFNGKAWERFGPIIRGK